MSITAGANALSKRAKNRKLPTVAAPQAADAEVSRSIEGVLEHLRMYEGDSNAPKERFVTIAELEDVGLIASNVKSRFAFISKVQGIDVTQPSAAVKRVTPVITNSASAETDPVFLAHDAAAVTSTLIANWDIAFSWGNHASAGYSLTSHDHAGVYEPVDTNLVRRNVAETISSTYTFSRTTGPQITIKDSDTPSGDAHVGWIDFTDSADVSQGFVGYGSGSNQNLHVWNEVGPVALSYVNAQKLVTTNAGVSVTGDVAATTIGGVVSANLLDKSTSESVSGTWDFTGQSIGMNRGINGNYSGKDGTSAFGAAIWTIDTGWALSDSGDSYVPTSQYGISWLRPSNANANSNAGEGLYGYVNGVEYFSIGTNGLAVKGNAYFGGDTIGHFESVTGNYGSVQVGGAEGAAGSWEGYSIAGQLVFMSIGGTDATNRGGIYNESGGNEKWVLQHNRTGAFEAELYHDNNAKLATIANGITVSGGVTMVPNGTVGADEIHYAPAVRGGSYNGNTAEQTGYMLFEFPDGSHSDSVMGTLEIHGYDYSGVNGTVIGSWGVAIGGYHYAAGNYINNSVDVLYGKPPFDTVRLGEATSNKYIILGTSSTIWNYPQVMVRNEMRGFSTQADGGLWTVTISTSLPAGWAQSTAWTIGGSLQWRTTGLAPGGAMTISTVAASGGVDGDIHFRY